MDNTYVPGTCNIGKKEIAKRRNDAILELVIALVLAVCLVFFNTNKLWRLVLFIPLTLSAVGFQQWYFKFCVRFGLMGMFNFGELGKTDTVEQAEMRKLDKAKAMKVIITSILIGLILSIVFYLTA